MPHIHFQYISAIKAKLPFLDSTFMQKCCLKMAVSHNSTIPTPGKSLRARCLVALLGLTAKSKGLTHRSAPTSLSIEEALLLQFIGNYKQKLTTCVNRDPHGITYGYATCDLSLRMLSIIDCCIKAYFASLILLQQSIIPYTILRRSVR